MVAKLDRPPYGHRKTKGSPGHRGRPRVPLGDCIRPGLASQSRIRTVRARRNSVRSAHVADGSSPVHAVRGALRH